MDKQTLQDLWSNALKQPPWTFVLDDVTHDLSEGLERDAVPSRRWLRLETNFGDNKWLCEDGSERLRQGSKDCEKSVRK